MPKRTISLQKEEKGKRPRVTLKDQVKKDVGGKGMDWRRIEEEQLWKD